MTSDDLLMKRVLDMGRETTPGTAVSPTIPQLWAGEVVKALTTQTPAWPRTTAKPLTFWQKLRIRWHRLLAKWPLQWKRDDDEGDWD